ncbi:MAG: potassium-transporting ATPase subunit B, partial [Luteimonas sp.]
MKTSSTSTGRLRRASAGMDRASLGVAALEAVKKLSPRHALRSPVMAIVLLGTLLTFLISLTTPGAMGYGLLVSAILLV